VWSEADSSVFSLSLSLSCPLLGSSWPQLLCCPQVGLPAQRQALVRLAPVLAPAQRAPLWLSSQVVLASQVVLSQA